MVFFKRFFVIGGLGKGWGSVGEGLGRGVGEGLGRAWLSTLQKPVSKKTINAP